MGSVFAERRRALMDRLGGGAAIFLAAPEKIRNNDVHYDYRQDSDFWYLTGFPEPDAVLVLRPGQTPSTVMFVRQKDVAKEIWTGVRAGPEGAVARYGADVAHPLDALRDELPKLLDGASRLHHALGRDPAFDRQHVLRWLERARNPRSSRDAAPEIVDVTAVLHEMRLRKDAGELDALRRAGGLAAKAHVAAMRHVRPGMIERDVQAVIEYVSRKGGAPRMGYPTIVGAGPHATILHHVDNDGPIRDGDLVLVDAGCEIDYYTADLTRTFPASGRFTEPQKALYAIVLEAQLAAIDACRAGSTFQGVHDAAVDVLVDGMLAVGLLHGDRAAIVKDEGFKKYYMHKTSHWLGMDVHDVGRYVRAGEPRVLEPGHVLTVEPGIYVAAGDEEAPPAFRGIGIRIEDDVVVTGGAPEVLTAAAPKTIADIERECARRLPLPSFE